MFFDWQLTWKKHICSKRKHLGLKLSKIYWAELLGRTSQNSTDTGKRNTTIGKYNHFDIQYSTRTVANSIETLQKWQSKIHGIITFYVTNDTFYHDPEVSIIKGIIKEFYQRYCERLMEHLKNLCANLMKAREIMGRLKRKSSTNLLN